MAIEKKDCLVLLSDLKKMGIDTNEITSSLLKNDNIISTLKFINDNRPLDVARFYEKLRKSYNQKKSKLYKNLMSDKISENNINEVLNTLNSYALQMCLFSQSSVDIKNKKIFYKFARLDEVYKCLYHYSISYDLIPCIKLLEYIKSDIKVLESIYRENNETNNSN